ncbi:MAG: hypothetical protein KAT05_11455 [Spirochaetes bacterium]|nr:hypothetical protein [Spirochaetota bacterium]
MNPWNWTRFIKAKTTLFAVGILIGIIGTLIYLKVDFSKLLDLPDIEAITAWAPVIAASSTVILAIITGVYVFITRSMLNEQRKTINRERLSKEMDLVVAPLTQRKGDLSIFIYGMLSRGNPEQVVYDFYNFWDGIEQNKYLTTKYLSLAINEYLSHKESYPSAPPTDAYNAGKLKLYEAMDKRYQEIFEELKGLE